MGAGDSQKRSQFEAEALPHLGALFTTALHLTRNRDDADDLCQETMLRAYRFFHQFRPGTDCRAWLLTIMYNAFRSGYSRRQGREQVSASPEDFERAIDAESGQHAPAADPQELLMRSGMDENLEKALDSLPEEFRTALLLVDINELSYAEAARAMEVPIGTVRSRLSRARSMMRCAVARLVSTKRSAGS
jgi:RNA polymerase sigma-70 factor (ECF subfamily)